MNRKVRTFLWLAAGLFAWPVQGTAQENFARTETIREKTAHGELAREERIPEKMAYWELAREEKIPEKTAYWELAREEKIPEKTAYWELAREEKIPEKTAYWEFAREGIIPEKTVYWELAREGTIPEKTAQEKSARGKTVQEKMIRDKTSREMSDREIAGPGPIQEKGTVNNEAADNEVSEMSRMSETTGISEKLKGSKIAGESGMSKMAETTGIPGISKTFEISGTCRTSGGPGGSIPEMRIQLPVTSVAVFADRAQITMKGNVQVPAGKTELVVTGIPVRMLEGTLQCSATGKVSILSITPVRDETVGKIEEDAWRQRAGRIRDSMDRCKIRVAVLENEKELLLANRQAGGSEGVKAAELKQLADFMSARLSDIALRIHEYRKEIERLEAVREELGTRAEQELQKQERIGTAVRILTESPSAASCDLTVSYIASGAGWTPLYDIRLPEEGGEAVLNYKANVRQFTGLDWENVSLVLSSGNPASIRQVPVIYPYYLRNEPVISKLQNNMLNMAAQRNMPMAVMAVNGAAGNTAGTNASEQGNEFSVAEETVMEPDEGMQVLSDPSRSMNNVNYAIKIPYTIPTDANGTGSRVQVAQYPLKVEYEYIITPRVSQEALLVAGIPDFSSYNLLDGEITLYLGNSYRGTQYIDRSAVSPLNDVLSLSMGPDKDIVVKRVSRQNYRKVTGSTVLVRRAFETTVRNNKNVAVKIKIEDQYPLSQDDKIKVEDLAYAPENVKVDRTTGKLTWEITLHPQESIAINLGYAVRHPKDWNIVVR